MIIVMMIFIVIALPWQVAWRNQVQHALWKKHRFLRMAVFATGGGGSGLRKMADSFHDV